VFYKIIAVRWWSVFFVLNPVYNLRTIKCLYCSFRNQNSPFRLQMHNVCLCQSEMPVQWGVNTERVTGFITKISNKMHYIYRLIYYSKSVLRVSGDVFAYLQEHFTVFTVSGSVYPSCCRLVSWMIWNWTMWAVRRVYSPHNPHSSVSTYPRHQPAATWVNTTRYCK
jgi:hypothetical protein